MDFGFDRKQNQGSLLFIHQRDDNGDDDDDKSNSD